MMKGCMRQKGWESLKYDKMYKIQIPVLIFGGYNTQINDKDFKRVPNPLR